MKRIIIAALVGVLLVVPGVRAANNFQTIADFVSGCEKEPYNKIYCTGVLRGVASMMTLFDKTCMPETGARAVSNAQLRQVFLNWAKANPKKWHERGEWGMVLAFTQTWPC